MKIFHIQKVRFDMIQLANVWRFNMIQAAKALISTKGDLSRKVWVHFAVRHGNQPKAGSMFLGKL